MPTKQKASPVCGTCHHVSASAHQGCNCSCHTLFAGILGYQDEKPPRKKASTPKKKGGR